MSTVLITWALLYACHDTDIIIHFGPFESRREAYVALKTRAKEIHNDYGRCTLIESRSKLLNWETRKELE